MTRLDEIEARTTAATEGPWSIREHRYAHHYEQCVAATIDQPDQMEQSPWPRPTVAAIRQHLGEDV